MRKRFSRHSFSRHLFTNGLLIAVFLTVTCRVAARQPDTLSFESPSYPWYHHRLVKISGNTVPLFAMGLFFNGRDDGIRTFRNSYAPSFHSEYDDFLQYIPLSVALGLKLFGVKGSGSWKEWFVSNGFGGLSLFTLVNGIKYGMQKLRPGSSAHNSFPSGHTAMAFYGATLLHHEYGRTLSPWVSVGGYAVAIGTATGRILNNRHWFSDVLAGAAIGIFSAQLGYYLSDLIFHKPSTDGFQSTTQENAEKRTPTFIGLNLGLPWGWQFGKFGSQTGFRIHAYHSVQLEGAFFFHTHWGVGSFFSLYNGKLEVLPSQSSMIMHLESNRPNEHANLRHWRLGVQLWGGTPLIWDTWLFATLSVGGGLFTPLSVKYHTVSEPNSVQDLTITPDFSLFYGLSMSIGKEFGRKWGVKAFVEISHEHIPTNMKKTIEGSTSAQSSKEFASLFSIQPGISLLLFMD